MEAPHPLEGGITLLRGLIADRPELEHEFVTSRSEFFCLELPEDPESPVRLLADRRYLEWFAFEHTSKVLGEIPASALFDAWMETADAGARLFADALQHSHTGVFVVKSVDPGVGLWLEDLLGRGAYPVEDRDASKALEEGDLMAGRLYPVGDSQFRMSPAVAVYRNPRLRDALQRDLAEARGGRRGTLRVSQAEIERLFFSARTRPQEDDAEGVEVLDPAERRVRLVALLEEHGLDADEVEPWLEALEEVAEDSGAVTALVAEVMDRAAFDSEVDLELLRAELHALVEETRRARKEAAAGPKVEAGPGTAEGPLPAALASAADLLGLVQPAEPAAPENETDEPSSAEEVERALAEFDAGRAAGKPLEELFGTLERELGLQGGDGERDSAAPDFPGVVGALVEEFLWERDAEGRALSEPAATSLRDLAQRCASIGLAEELDVQHLVDFAARWTIDAGKLGTEYAAEDLLGALEEFSRWTEESQQILLWTAYRRVHGELELELPRVADVTVALGRTAPEDERRARLTALERRDGTLGARTPDGGFQPLEAQQLEAFGERLAEGDMARLVDGGSAWRLVRLYPSAGRGA